MKECKDSIKRRQLLGAMGACVVGAALPLRFAQAEDARAVRLFFRSVWDPA
jgi:hypothetical protein